MATISAAPITEIAMPLVTLEDYEKLGEHLSVIEPDLADFAALHGYTVYPRLSGGRYPNRRITREGSVTRSIHISMDDAKDGERFDTFYPEIPYSIWGLAWIDDFQQQLRWHGPMIGLKRVPFSVLTRTLRFHLSHFHAHLSEFSEHYIKACAITSTLG